MYGKPKTLEQPEQHYHSTDSLMHWCYISSCSFGLAPSIMYGEQQCTMGPYRTVHIALYIFTNKHVFLACSDETHTKFTLLHMPGLACYRH